MVIYLYRLPEELARTLQRAFLRLGYPAYPIGDLRELPQEKKRTALPLILCDRKGASKILPREDLALVLVLNEHEQIPLAWLTQGVKAYFRYPAPEEELLALLAQLTGVPPP